VAWLLKGANTEFFFVHSWIAHDLNHINPNVHAIWKTFTYSHSVTWFLCKTFYNSFMLDTGPENNLKHFSLDHLKNLNTALEYTFTRKKALELAKIVKIDLFRCMQARLV
jgi:hypothetical protein